ncbi:MAG: hypothetical protein KC910_00045 [Candidatus Eremiobacteraeota bacterium]|nr:hypothetical protein [Candidatus Eremiobacteraeota bacterium]
METNSVGTHGLVKTPLSRPLYTPELRPTATVEQACVGGDHAERLKSWAKTQDPAFRDYVYGLMGQLPAAEDRPAVFQTHAPAGLFYRPPVEVPARLPAEFRGA